MNHWCESCARKNLCYVVGNRPKCFVPITNTASGTPYLVGISPISRDNHEIATDEPQTEYPCDTCANKGDHDGECSNCVLESEPIRWETPSHYKPKDEPQTCSVNGRPYDCGNCEYHKCTADEPQTERNE